MNNKTNRSKNIPSQALLKKNLLALSVHHKDLVKRISEFQDENRFEILRVGNDPSYNLLFKDTGEYLYQSGNVAEEIRVNFEHINTMNPQITFIVGFGLGYELMYFLRQIEKSKRTRFLCIFEKDIGLFKYALMCNDFSDIFSNDNISFFIGDTAENLYSSLLDYFMNQQKFLLSKAFSIIYNPFLFRKEKTYYKNIISSIREAIVGARNNFGNSPLDSIIGVENMLSNLDSIIENPGVNHLKDKFNDIPAIVVSTGPSLDKNKHLLKGLRDKAIIISVDTSFKILMKEGIKPHFVVSMERGFEVKDIVNGFSKEELGGIYFAFCPVIDRAAVRSFYGEKVVVYRNFDHFKWLDIDKGIVDSKMSVGNMAFKFAEYIGCKKIILIGQDLAFSNNEGSKTHADGTGFIKTDQDQEKAKSDLGPTFYVKGNLQERVLTSSAWYTFLKAYEHDVSQYDGECINSTEGGAYIPGTKIMPLREAVQCYLEVVNFPLRRIKDYLPPIKKSKVDEQKNDILKLIENTKKDIESILSLLKKGLNAVEKHQSFLFDALTDQKKYLEFKQKKDFFKTEIFGPFNKAISNYNKTFQLFLAHILQSVSLTHGINFNSVFGKYADWDKGEIERLLLQQDFYYDEYRIIEIAKDRLTRAEKLLETKRWEVSDLAIEYNKTGFIDIPKYLEEVKDII